ncbi:MAG TPA: ATP-binding protein [Mycobacteriales bacterium]|nr:ATP-binding protein [Mycobacteriales bacterium]
MRDIYEAIRLVELAGFVALGVFAIRMWASRRTPAHAWLAATFGILGGIVVFDRIIPADSDVLWTQWADRILVAVLALFPYCLYRFMLTFRPRIPWVFAVAHVATGIVVVWSLLLPEVPDEGEPRTAAFTAYLIAFLVHWTGLSLLVAVRLWRAGTGQPTVARRRMRTLALGAIGLAVALLISGSSGSDTEITPARLAVQLFALASAPLFLLGFAPPASVVALWRRHEENELREAEIGLMTAMAPKEVAESLLPRVVRLVGGDGAAIVGSNGAVLGVYGMHDRDVRVLAEKSVGRPPAEDVEVTDDLLWVPMPSGAWLMVTTTAYMPFFGREDSRALLALGVMTDLALGRASLFERERRNVDTMRDFVAIASHDLRTPTAVINGYATMLDSKWSDLPEAQRRDMTATIRRQSVHLSRLIEDLLTISQIEAAGIRTMPDEIPVEEAVREIVKDLGDAAEGVRVEIDPALRLYADHEHFRRIITNYLRNASVYGAPPVLVEGHREGRSAVIRVIDHGAGVPPEFAPRLFQKFARADKKMSKATQGTGLGLSIVRGLARAAGGDAWYVPNQPSGSIFAVRLPSASPANSREEQ